MNDREHMGTSEVHIGTKGMTPELAKEVIMIAQDSRLHIPPNGMPGLEPSQMVFVKSVEDSAKKHMGNNEPSAEKDTI